MDIDEFAIYSQDESGWNTYAAIDSSWGGRSAKENVDEVGFLRAVVDEARSIASVPREAPVYALGFSNGGTMTYRLACEASDLVAGIGVMGAMTPFVESGETFWGGPCNPHTPRPLWTGLGTKDDSLAGTTDQALSNWRNYSTTGLGCTASTEAVQEAIPSNATGVPSIICRTYSDCKSKLCFYTDLDHKWASSNPDWEGVDANTLPVLEMPGTASALTFLREALPTASPTAVPTGSPSSDSTMNFLSAYSMKIVLPGVLLAVSLLLA